MYRLLIVDDEAIIADGLYEVFQNIKYLELDVYKAYSGYDALNLLNRTRIDIVLTDIRMPGMDGLQLLDNIHERWPKCKVIFLTGYDEFDYVYKAIQYDGISYLLKTEGYGKVIQVVENAVAEIEKEFKAEELILKAKEQLGTMTELLQKDYFNGILKGELTAHDINQQQFKELGVSINAASPMLMLLGHIDDFSKVLSYSEKSRKLYSIKLITERYFSSRVSYVHFIDENSNLIWLIQPKNEDIGTKEEKDPLWSKMLIFIKGNLELVQAACKESVGVMLSFALDDTLTTWEETAGRYSMLKMLLNYRIGQGGGMLLTDKSIVQNELNQQIGCNREKLYVSQFKLEMLADYLEHGQKADFTQTLEELTRDLKKIKSIHYIPAQELYYSIALLFLSYINRWNLMEKIAFKTGLYKLMQVDAHESWSDAVGNLIDLGNALLDVQDFEQEKRAQDAISRVQQHINDHIHAHDELTLVRLADLVYFNPSYLSRLFKQVAGINLSDYICEMKIKKTKHLLENTDMKIHEVAEAVGYSSATNFARFFKKLTNMTPQEYRDSFLGTVK